MSGSPPTPDIGLIVRYGSDGPIGDMFATQQFKHIYLSSGATDDTWPKPDIWFALVRRSERVVA